MTPQVKKLDDALNAAISDFIMENGRPFDLVDAILKTSAAVILSCANKKSRENPIEMAKEMGVALVKMILLNNAQANKNRNLQELLETLENSEEE